MKPKDAKSLTSAGGKPKSESIAITVEVSGGIVQNIYSTYRRERFPEETIIRPIILKKIEFIKAAESGKQLREILAPTKVRYSGGEIRPVGPYAIPEEELAIWSRTSLMAGAPLIAPAAKRYMELFRQVFPELAEEFGI